jgi:hypothetical protein
MKMPGTAEFNGKERRCRTGVEQRGHKRIQRKLLVKDFFDRQKLCVQLLS